MLKINNNIKFPLLLFAISISGLFLFQYLTFIPTYSSAESIETSTPETRTLADVKTMQEVTPEICANTPEADTTGKYQYPLIDTRDNQTYTVAKLRDNNCWMTQNMNYDDGLRMATSSPYGGYYDWASALTACTKVTDNINAWILPTKEQFETLISAIPPYTPALNNTTIMAAPYYFNYSGLYNGLGDFYQQGNIGYYWSSTKSGDTGAYGLSFSRGGTNVEFIDLNISSGGGFTARCTLSRSDAAPPADSISSPNINVNVPNILTLSTSGPVTAEKNSEGIMVGDFTTTVSSNSGYHISLSATEPNLVNQDKPTYHISPSNNITINNYGWGIKCKSSINSNCTKPNYTAITNQLQTFYSTTNTTTSTETLFEVGISVDPSLPSGTYSTELTVTASQD